MEDHFPLCFLDQKIQPPTWLAKKPEDALLLTRYPPNSWVGEVPCLRIFSLTCTLLAGPQNHPPYPFSHQPSGRFPHNITSIFCSFYCIHWASNSRHQAIPEHLLRKDQANIRKDWFQFWALSLPNSENSAL